MMNKIYPRHNDKQTVYLKSGNALMTKQLNSYNHYNGGTGLFPRFIKTYPT